MMINNYRARATTRCAPQVLPASAASSRSTTPAAVRPAGEAFTMRSATAPFPAEVSTWMLEGMADAVKAYKSVTAVELFGPGSEGDTIVQARPQGSSPGPQE